MSNGLTMNVDKDPELNYDTVRAIKIERARPYVQAWLYITAFVIFIMVLVGGTTRLTDSGLSITEWQPILGAIPPLNDMDWAEAFDKYKLIPEFKIQNSHMTMDEFKFIYWWEWGHRFLGRFIGVLFFIPFMFFLLTGRLEKRQIIAFSFIFILGGLQGYMGWYMVKSGLVDRVDVSQYRLSAHLTLAFILFALIIWSALGVRAKNTNVLRAQADKTLVRSVEALLLLLFLQIAMGGFVAGIDAGFGYNTWPKMEGQYIPEGLLYIKPWYLNFFESALTIQFTHRTLAYIIILYAIFHLCLTIKRAATPASCMTAILIVAVIVAQSGLGIWTLLARVPIDLALIHQGGALIVVLITLIHLHYLARIR